MNKFVAQNPKRVFMNKFKVEHNLNTLDIIAMGYSLTNNDLWEEQEIKTTVFDENRIMVELLGIECKFKVVVIG